VERNRKEEYLMKCSHTACNCKTKAGDEYCSNECASSERDEGATDCHCGHEECVASAAPDRDSERN
jgi:hypothetical protein